MTTFTDEAKIQTQANLQSVLKDMQGQRQVPPTPRVTTHESMEMFLDRPTIMEIPAISRTDKLPTSRQKTLFEMWLDGHIYEWWQAEHKFPHIIYINSIRKLEYIVQQLEREDAPVRWHEYQFRHTNGWISIQLETKIMNYSEVECA